MLAMRKNAEKKKEKFFKVNKWLAHRCNCLHHSNKFQLPYENEYFKNLYFAKLKC